MRLLPDGHELPVDLTDRAEGEQFMQRYNDGMAA